jgi:hypothetical protein
MPDIEIDFAGDALPLDLLDIPQIDNCFKGCALVIRQAIESLFNFADDVLQQF